MLLSDSFLSKINPSSSSWELLDITKNRRRLNRILQKDHVQRAFHDATLAYWAVKRWDIFHHFRNSIPEPVSPVDGKKYVLPCQVDSSDWRCTFEKGRPPLFHDYCLSRACHWMAMPNLLVAQLLFPEVDWVIFSSDKHTGVASIQHQLLFDPYFFAVNVSATETMKLLFGEDFDNSEMCELHDEDEPYDYLNGAAGYALRFWEAADQYNGTSHQLARLMNDFLDKHRDEDRLGLLIEVDDPQLNTQVLNLNYLSHRPADAVLA